MVRPEIKCQKMKSFYRHILSFLSSNLYLADSPPPPCFAGYPPLKGEENFWVIYDA